MCSFPSLTVECHLFPVGLFNAGHSTCHSRCSSGAYVPQDHFNHAGRLCLVLYAVRVVLYAAGRFLAVFPRGIP